MFLCENRHSGFIHRHWQLSREEMPSPLRSGCTCRGPGVPWTTVPCVHTAEGPQYAEAGPECPKAIGWSVEEAPRHTDPLSLP